MKRLPHALIALLLSGSPGIPAAHARDETAGAAAGHPRITLDRLDSAVPLAQADEKFLRDALAKEARAADWGAGKDARIEFRFRLDELSVTELTNVVRVQCSATGTLPRGKRARGHLALGGAPKDRQALVHHVLSIVAKSVVTRLADMERRRRTR